VNGGLICLVAKRTDEHGEEEQWVVIEDWRVGVECGDVGYIKPPSFSLLLLFTTLEAYTLIKGLTDVLNVVDVVVVVI
jgi:hypothetical protein